DPQHGEPARVPPADLRGCPRPRLASAAVSPRPDGVGPRRAGLRLPVPAGGGRARRADPVDGAAETHRGGPVLPDRLRLARGGAGGGGGGGGEGGRGGPLTSGGHGPRGGGGGPPTPPETPPPPAPGGVSIPPATPTAPRRRTCAATRSGWPRATPASTSIGNS